MADIIVCKFGGSSITRYNDISRIEKIAEDDSRRRVIVVSAPGKLGSSEEKVTDMLIRLAESGSSALLEKIISRYKMLCPDCDLGMICSLLEERLSLKLDKKQYLDAVKSIGEEACARIIAKAINAEFVDPKQLFFVSEEYGNAKILKQTEHMTRARLRGREGLFVVPGFYGYTESGTIATLSRGGSDLTGAYICAALDAQMYENFTDIGGIYAASPQIVANPKKINAITFDEMRDLSYSGFSVFHEEAMGPVSRKRIPVHVRNTFAYPEEGTYIIHDRLTEPGKPIVGVAYKEGLCSFDTAGFGLKGIVGIERKILQVFENEGIPVEFITTGIDDLSVIVREEQLKEPPNSIGGIIDRIYLAAGRDASIRFQEHLGSLVVAGKGLRGKKGISADIQRTLAEAGVNIKFISQGPLERCIIYGIEHSDSRRAVNAVYDRYLR